MIKDKLGNVLNIGDILVSEQSDHSKREILKIENDVVTLEDLDHSFTPSYKCKNIHTSMWIKK